MLLLAKTRRRVYGILFRNVRNYTRNKLDKIQRNCKDLCPQRYFSLYMKVQMSFGERGTRYKKQIYVSSDILNKFKQVPFFHYALIRLGSIS